VIPGMSLHLNCSSKCLPDDATVTWSLLPNNTTPVEFLPVNKSPDYVLSADNGLVILNVNASEHSGTFQCSYNNYTLTKHRISLSGSRFMMVFFLSLYIFRAIFTYCNTSGHVCTLNWPLIIIIIITLTISNAP